MFDNFQDGCYFCWALAVSTYFSNGFPEFSVVADQLSCGLRGEFISQDIVHKILKV